MPPTPSRINSTTTGHAPNLSPSCSHSPTCLTPATIANNNGNSSQFTSHTTAGVATPPVLSARYIHHQSSTSSLTSPLLPGPSSRVSSFRPLPAATAPNMGPLPPPAKDSVATMTKQHKQRQRKRRCIFLGTLLALALVAGGVTAYFTLFRNKGSAASSTSSGGAPAPSGFPSNNPADRNPTVTDLSRSQPRVTTMPQISVPLSKPIAIPMDLAPPSISTFARFGNGKVWGHHIWGDNYIWAPTVKEVQQRHGYTPGALGGFYHLDVATGLDHPDWFLSHAKQAADAQAWFFVSVEPREQGLNIEPDTFDKVADLLRRATVDIGATVVLRWAHEMNGAWYSWSQQPLKYVQVWRDFRARIKKAAPKVTMVWSPNIGQFDPTRLKPKAGSPEFIALDTSKDGKVDENDDPYTPYFPGKDHVDFIGISFFWFGPTWDTRTNALPPTDELTAKLTKPFDLLKFARDQNLPFILSETGCMFYPDEPAGPGELAMKQAWWRMLMSFPDVVMIMYFDFIKKEDGPVLSSTVTNSTTIIDAFKSDVASRPLVFGPQP